MKQEEVSAKADPDVEAGGCPTASSNESHSPLPWHVYEDETIVDANGFGAGEAWDANAVFIVLAVNQHASLVSTVSELRAQQVALVQALKRSAHLDKCELGDPGAFTWDADSYAPHYLMNLTRCVREVEWFTDKGYQQRDAVCTCGRDTVLALVEAGQ